MRYDYITIGIIVRNEEVSLPHTLQYLFQQKYPIKDYCEIIIADGDSTDHTREVASSILKQSGVTHQVLNEKDFKDSLGVGYGHSRGRNVILMHAHKRSKYIAWIDGDCRADENRLINLWDTIKNNNSPMVAGVGGTRFVETQGTISLVELILNYYFTSNIISLGNPAFTPKSNITYIPSVAGYNSIFKKEIFEKYQYNTSFPFNIDDLEMNFKLTKQGYRFLYSKDAVIYHRGADTLNGFLKQMKNYGKGVAHTMKIHHTPFVRVYAWIGLGYVFYTIFSPLIGYFSYNIFGTWLYSIIPYVILLGLGIAVFIENYKKTNSLTSLIVIPTLFAHLRYYGLGVTQGLLTNKD